jgi:hypothetical protein
MGLCTLQPIDRTLVKSRASLDVVKKKIPVPDSNGIPVDMYDCMYGM